ncbi:hypothetical protein MMC16_000673 [Acarospora aff. strigata]|nr:hypothetical protein [Acarospora aff. strigata]
MFREPEVPDSKAAIKADPSAPARSAIRRQRSVRYPRDHAASSRPYSASRSAERRTLLELIRQDRDTPNPNADTTVQAEADRARAEASNRLRLENGRALLRDAQSYERPGRRMRIPRNSSLHHQHHADRGYHLASASSLPVPADEAMGRYGQAGTRLSPPRSIPTPPYTVGEPSNRSSPAANAITTPLGSASLTPRFAPAYRFDEVAHDPRRSSTIVVAPRSEAIPPSASRLDGVENPSLQRAGHRSITDSIRQENARVSRRVGVHVDGLGDRERSFSPEDESWETLLTTIAPDEHLPSASSSFTSATASASSLSSNSAPSSNTVFTEPSSTSERSETLMTFPVCDMSDSDDSETDAEDWELHTDDDSDDTPARNPDQYADDIQARRERIDRIVDTRETARLERLMGGSEETVREEEMTHLHSVIERLAQRDDIPDEWWASAGLNRNLGGLELRVRELMDRIDRLEVRRLEMERTRAALNEREEERERVRLQEAAQERAREAERARQRTTRRRRPRGHRNGRPNQHQGN